MTDHVRWLAECCGRGADIVKFGSGPCAVPVNLLAHMDMFDPADKEHARFISMIEHEQFHVLSFDPKKTSGSSSSYAEQAAWRLNAIRSGLDAFRKAPGILRNFAATDGEAIPSFP